MLADRINLPTWAVGAYCKLVNSDLKESETRSRLRLLLGIAMVPGNNRDIPSPSWELGMWGRALARHKKSLVKDEHVAA